MSLALSGHSSNAFDAPVQAAATVIETRSNLQPQTGAGSGPPEQPLSARRSIYLPLIVNETKGRNLPPAVADAVMSVESGYDPNRVGGVGELGLMQVRPETAAMLGYKGSAAGLFEPAVNIRYGVAYLAEAWRLASGDLCRALMKYRAGHGERRMTPRSLEYCARARAHLAVIGSSPSLISGATGTDTSYTHALSDPSNVFVQRHQSALAELRRRAWAEYVTRIHTIEARTATIVSSN
jgi:soluble lytic murein transglycosylase-like protein